ncbi:MAG: hypothetical protein ACO1SV_01200 [Fimbriimonas sp.]
MMRGIWVALIMLVAALGGATSGYVLNVCYGPRTSLHPLRVAPRATFSVRVHRVTYIAASTDEPPPRLSTPGIIDTSPREPVPVAASGGPALDGISAQNLAQ